MVYVTYIYHAWQAMGSQYYHNLSADCRRPNLVIKDAPKNNVKNLKRGKYSYNITYGKHAELSSNPTRQYALA